MATYITREGDLLDQICYERFGYTEGIWPQVLADNRHLALLPLELPAGTKIVLPDKVPVVQPATLDIWN